MEYQKKQLTYFNKRLDDVMLHHLKYAVDVDSIVFIDVIIGGDHGQGAMRFPAKFIFFYDDDSTAEVTTLISQIDCAKETYKLIEQCTAPSINEALARMMHNETTDGLSPDGSVVVEDDVSYFSDPEDDPLPTSTKQIPFRFFMSGDLAYDAMCLGKDSSSTAWCIYCKMRRADWRKKHQHQAEVWTMESLHDMAYDDSKKKSQRLGVKENMLPLFPAIQVIRWMVPLLHILLGVGNDLLKNILKFVMSIDGVENLPQPARDAINAYFIAEEELYNHQLQYDLWQQDSAQILASKQQEKKNLIKTKNTRAYRRSSSQQEKQQLQQAIDALTTEIAALQNEKAHYVELIRQLKNDATAKSQVMDEKLKEVPKHLLYIRGCIEEILKTYGIDRAAHHGGDLVGGAIRKMMANGRSICDDICELVLKVAGDNGKDVDGEFGEAIRERFDIYGETLIRFDALFTLLYTDHTTYEGGHFKLVNDAYLVKEKAIHLIRMLGMNVTPKLHIVEDHIIDYLIAFGSLKIYDEQFVERAHQEGKRTQHSWCIHC